MPNLCLFSEYSIENEIARAERNIINLLSSGRMQSLLSHISSDESSRRIDEVLSEVSDLALKRRYTEIPAVVDSIASHLTFFIKKEQVETILLIREEASKQTDNFFERVHSLQLLYEFYAATDPGAVKYLYQAYTEARSIIDPKEKIYCQSYILAHIADAKIKSSSIDFGDHKDDLDKLDTLDAVEYLRTCGAKQCLSIVKSYLDISLSPEEATSDLYNKSLFVFYSTLSMLHGFLRQPAEAFNFATEALKVQEKTNLFTEDSLEIRISRFFLVSDEINSLVESDYQYPTIVLANLIEELFASLEKIKEIAGSTPRFYYHLLQFYQKIVNSLGLESDNIKSSIPYMNFVLSGLFSARAAIQSFERENYSQGIHYYASLGYIGTMYRTLTGFSEELRPLLIEMHSLESDFFDRCYAEVNQSVRKAIQLKIAAGNYVMAIPNYIALYNNYIKHNPQDLVNAEQVIREGIECSRKIYAINNNQYPIVTLRMYEYLVEICYRQDRMEEVKNLISEVKHIASEMKRYHPLDEIASRMIRINEIAEKISCSAPAARP